MFEQFSADTAGFNPEVAAIIPMQARYVIGPDDIIAYADINVDYHSEPELSSVLLVLQRCRTPSHKDVADEARNHPGRASVDLSSKTGRPPTSAVTRCDDTIYVFGFPPF
jgi:hypothetical protein